MLNYIFVFATYWAISGPLKLPNARQPITGDVGNLNASLPIIFGRDLNAGILLALVAVPLIWFLLYRTTLGLRDPCRRREPGRRSLRRDADESPDRPDHVDRRLHVGAGRLDHAARCRPPDGARLRHHGRFRCNHRSAARAIEPDRSAVCRRAARGPCGPARNRCRSRPAFPRSWSTLSRRSSCYSS